MDELKQRILKDGHALNQQVLRVDSFLNHQVDPQLMHAIGEAFGKYFRKHHFDKVITVEASGIAPAQMTALALGLPLLIMKKQTSKILKGDMYKTPVHSFTKENDYHLCVSKKYLKAGEKYLLIDDFLAYGQVVMGVKSICEEAGASLGGVGIVIEKSFQPGRALVEEQGLDILSLARIKSLAEGYVEFLEA